MENKEKIVTLFRTRQCKQSKTLCDALEGTNIDQEAIQVVYIPEQPDISAFFRIKASPTVLLFADGEEVQRYENDIDSYSIITSFLKG